MSQVDSKGPPAGPVAACLSAAASADTSLTSPIGIEIPEATAAEGAAAVSAPTVKDDNEGIRCSVNAKLFTCIGNSLTQFNNSLRNSFKSGSEEPPHQQLLTTVTENDDFDGLDLGDDPDCPDPSCLEPLGEILGAEVVEGLEVGTYDPADTSNLIRLHGEVVGEDVGGENEEQTISATVNVATLDLSDPEAIHQHLSQLNDTVLRVQAFDDADDNSITQGHQQQQLSDGSTLVSSLMSPSSQSSPSSSGASTFLSPPPIDHPAPPTPTPTPPTGTSPATIRRGTPGATGSGSKLSQACTVCSKTFSNASALAKHRLTHSEERKYHCNICSKAFKRQDHLNGHLLTHRSTKPFACTAEGCGKSYCDARSLRRHRENHHSGLANGLGGGGLLLKKGPKPAVKHKKVTQLAQDLESGTKQTSASELDTKMISYYKSSEGTAQTDTSTAHKVKFSSKGLNAEQLQLIEKLLKESKSNNNLATNSSAATTDSSAAATAAAALAAVQSPPKGPVIHKSQHTDTAAGASNNKPVECTICNRKFKNVPALNGHMRLHGGYYKKDDKNKSFTAVATTAAAGEKRKAAAGTVCLSPLASINGLTVFQAKKSDLMGANGNLSISAAATPPSSLTIQPATAGDQPPAAKRPQLSDSCYTADGGSFVSPAPNPADLAFSSLPPPDTNKLLANLEMKQQIFNPVLNRFVTPGLEISTTQLVTSTSTSLSSSSKTLFTSSSSSSVPVTTSYQVEPATPKPFHGLKARTDSQPRIGSEHQAEIPAFQVVDEVKEEEPEVSELNEEKLWDPECAESLTDQEMRQFLTTACSMVSATPVTNLESGLKVLYKNCGNLRLASKELLRGAGVTEDTEQPEEGGWSDDEVDAFYENLMRHGKDFAMISSGIGSKSVKQCVEFYYFWKNLCRDEMRGFKTVFNNPQSPDEPPQLPCYGGSIVMASGPAPEFPLTPNSSSLLPFSVSITSVSSASKR